tara:strand:- start:617 stop:1375 length:759 start_codon:yes stop_codon:yes gene_type:complete
MTLIEAIILGVMQGLTEFLPISSSGHLVIMKHLLKIQSNGNEFEVLVHIGTLGSIIVVFFHDLQSIICDLKSKQNRLYIFHLLIASTPAALAGIFFKDHFDSFFDNYYFVGKALMFTGFILIVSYLFKPKNKKINFSSSIIIGLCQALAIIPGISRSGMTISFALLLGINAKDAAKFSFLMAIPIVSGAGFLTFLDSYNDFSIPVSQGFAALISSFLVGVFALNWLINLLGSRKLHYFGFYCFTVSIFTMIK